ncbi:hypothetical protein ABZW49_23275 [Nonomuraea wenchangensis]
MPHGDDLDQRFNELVGQIDDAERRRMRAEATRAAKEARNRRPPRQERGRRTRSSGSESFGPPTRPRRWGRALVVLSAVVAAAGLVVTYRPDLLMPGGTAGEGTATSPPTAIGEATGEIGETAATADPSRDPFAGSPAEHYAEGVKGFVLPEAKAMGGLSEKDVAKGLKRTRELLAAAYLDEKTLLGGAPDAFAKLLEPRQRRRFEDGLDDRRTTRVYVTSLAKGTAELATEVIKVKGRITLGAFRRDGRRGVEAKLNHLIIYAVRRPGRPDTTIRLATHPTGSVLMYRDGGRLVVAPRNWSAAATPARCGFDDGYIHPVYDDTPGTDSKGTGPILDPYDLDEPRKHGTCRRSKHT